MSSSTFNTAARGSAGLFGFVTRAIAAINARLDHAGAVIAEARALRAELARRYPNVLH